MVEELTADKEQLVKLLEYHIVSGKLTAADIAGNEQLYTRSGKSLTVLCWKKAAR